MALPALTYAGAGTAAASSGPAPAEPAPASLLDAETRFLEAKQRLLSLIRSSMDKVSTATTHALEADQGATAAAPLLQHPDGDFNYGNARSTAMYGADRAHRPSNAHGTAGAADVDERELALALPLLQPVKPRHRSASDSHHGASAGKGRPRTGGVTRVLSKVPYDGGVPHDEEKPNPLAGPVAPGRKPARAGGSAAAHKQPRDFDLRFGPAFSADLEKIRENEAEKQRRARYEAQHRLQQLAHLKHAKPPSMRGLSEGLHRSATASRSAGSHSHGGSPSRNVDGHGGNSGNLWLPPHLADVLHQQQPHYPGSAADAYWNELPTSISLPSQRPASSGSPGSRGMASADARQSRSATSYQTYTQVASTQRPAKPPTPQQISMLPPIAHSGSSSGAAVQQHGAGGTHTASARPPSTEAGGPIYLSSPGFATSAPSTSFFAAEQPVLQHGAAIPPELIGHLVPAAENGAPITQISAQPAAELQPPASASPGFAAEIALAEQESEEQSELIAAAISPTKLPEPHPEQPSEQPASSADAPLDLLQAVVSNTVDHDRTTTEDAQTQASPGAAHPSDAAAAPSAQQEATHDAQHGAPTEETGAAVHVEASTQPATAGESTQHSVAAAATAALESTHTGSGEEAAQHSSTSEGATEVAAGGESSFSGTSNEVPAADNGAELLQPGAIAAAPVAAMVGDAESAAPEAVACAAASAPSAPQEPSTA